MAHLGHSTMGRFCTKFKLKIGIPFYSQFHNKKNMQCSKCHSWLKFTLTDACNCGSWTIKLDSTHVMIGQFTQ